MDFWKSTCLCFETTRCWKLGSNHDLSLYILLPFESYIFQPLGDLSRRLSLWQQDTTSGSPLVTQRGVSSNQKNGNKSARLDVYGCVRIFYCKSWDMHPFQAVFARSLWQIIGKMTIHFEANMVFETASLAHSLACKGVYSELKNPWICWYSYVSYLHIYTNMYTL